MNDIILYAPVIAYFVFASIMFMFRKFIFGLHASVLITAMIANTYLSITTGGSILIAVIQIVFAIVSFILMVPFFAGKASGETMLAFTALVGLAPFSRFFTGSLVGFGLSIALFVAFAAFMHRDKIGDISSMVSDMKNPEEDDKKETVADATESKGVESKQVEESPDLEVEHNPGNVKDMLAVGLLSTYNGQLKLPDYSYLPDSATVKKEERFSFSVFALSGYSLVVAFNLINGLLFLDS